MRILLVRVAAETRYMAAARRPRGFGGCDQLFLQGKPSSLSMVAWSAGGNW